MLQGFIDFLEHLPRGGEGGGEVAAHADGLAALAREDEGVNRHGAETFGMSGYRVLRIGAGA